jgi:2-phospho-L-lactate guanylyltransferase
MGLDAFVEWIAVVPVKASRDAKTRLADHPERSALAQAMAQDTVNALIGADHITDVVLVADGAVDTTWASTVIPGAGSGLNPAIGVGAQWAASNRQSDFGLAIVTADLPCLTPDAMNRILALRDDAAVRIVGDAAGTGTTMLLVRDGRTVPANLTPQFGPHSCAAHVEAGALNLTTERGVSADDQAALLRARRDVDTDVDLWDAVRIGVGPATRAALMAD